DVELHLLARELLEVAADAVGLGASAADDNAGTSRVDVDTDAVTRTLDLHAADACAVHALGEHLADLDVFADVALVELVGVPTALVIRRDAQSEPVRVDLLSHYRFPPFFLEFLMLAASSRASTTSAGCTTTVRWLLRLRMRLAAPLARGRQRFMVGPSSPCTAVMINVERSRPSVDSALAAARWASL